jgi:anti-sigma factor RsiW
MTDTDPTNDIDPLLDYLAVHPFAGYHRALTALIAERDKLKARVAEQDADIKTLAAANAILHGRLEAHPPADRDRELRERLICAALNGILSEQRGLLNAEYALRAIGLADATLAAMRKGEA